PDWNCTDFFVRPNQQVGPNGIWYTKQAVGINTLGPLMKTISAKANLSKPYTGHCVRATVVTELHEAGYAVETIAKVTGNKSSTSVERYIRRGKRRDTIMTGMSEQLSIALDGTGSSERHSECGAV
uniref:Phage_integrase domain-containing protein n=1 Tax=Macrostomum lignano TaxID=282301 RepID=A0A1I8J2G2_9PLAT